MKPLARNESTSPRTWFLSCLLSASLGAGLAACTPKVPVTPVAEAGVSDATSAMDTFVRPDVYLNNDMPVMPEDAACATQSVGAEPVPLDLYVMMDSSRSMLETTTGGTNKWSAVSTALGAFFNDKQSEGIGIGLRFFPDVQPSVPATCTADAACGNFGPCDLRRSCVRSGTTSTAVTLCDTNATCASNETCSLMGTCPEGGYCVPAGSAACSGGQTCKPLDGYCHQRDICEAAPYATPAVAIAPLPGAAATLTAALAARTPDGFTPTGPALSGALQYARNRASANPSHKVAALLVTDGLPSECMPADIPGIAALASEAAAGTPPLPTFVIGVFSQTEATTATPNLNMLAKAGGTGAAVVISTNQDVTQVLQTALNQIRTKAIACEYKIPPATTGAIDFGKVNVQFTGGSGSTTTIGYTTSKAGCDPTRGGWYYDVDPATGGKPTSIKACDATCTQLQNDIAGRVDIVLGCVTITIS